MLKSRLLLSAYSDESGQLFRLKPVSSRQYLEELLPSNLVCTVPYPYVAVAPRTGAVLTPRFGAIWQEQH